MDEQHKRLIGLINDLHAAMMQGQGNDALGTILDDLVRYTQDHFRYEEALLAQRGYADLAGHRQEHRALTGRVVALREEFRSGKLTMSLEVMQFLKEWLANHILLRDMAYARALGAREVNPRA